MKVNDQEENCVEPLAVPLKELKHKCRAAIANHKIFTIRGSCSLIRNLLLDRGWIEKFEKRIPIGCSIERLAMSRLIALNQVNFFWTTVKDVNYDVTHRVLPNQLISKFAHAEFTSKAGLNLIIKQDYYSNNYNGQLINFPRCFNIYVPEEYRAFVKNFKLTASVSFLKLLLDKRERLFSKNGRIKIDMLNYASTKCQYFINRKSHMDIDANRIINESVSVDWIDFSNDYLTLLQNKDKIKLSANLNLKLIFDYVEQLLEKARKYSTQIDIDGHSNLWILKPMNKCRGIGILMVQSLAEIDRILVNDRRNYVIQKYIEKPFLIYGTKFDIRQWFLVTSVKPLVVWIYKECYLRFSSQPFDLKNFHESVHLTNYSIQKNYKASENRTKSLPDHHMWFLSEFQEYLKKSSMSTVWDTKIFPALVSIIVGIMIKSQNAIDQRPNTFEFFGADFMLDESLRPWLIEINSGPDMNPTTVVTETLCPKCIEDIVKVVIDYKENPKADTGNFRLAYKERPVKIPRVAGIQLLVQGKRLDYKVKQPRKYVSCPTNGNIDLHNYKGPVAVDVIENIVNNQ